MNPRTAVTELLIIAGWSRSPASATFVSWLFHKVVPLSLILASTSAIRPLSETFISDYLDAEWPEVGYTVGVFRLEARGVQLFSSIDGDHFTILGMPLLPLLGALRERGLLPA